MLRQAGSKGITKNDMRREQYAQHVKDNSAGHLKAMIFNNKDVVTAALKNNKKLLGTFNAYFIDGKKMSEIAENEKIKQNTVSMRIKRIKQIMRHSQDIDDLKTISNIAGKRYIKPVRIKCLNASEIKEKEIERQKRRNPFIGQKKQHFDADKYRAAKKRIAASYPKIGGELAAKKPKKTTHNHKATAFDLLWQKRISSKTSDNDNIAGAYISSGDVQALKIESARRLVAHRRLCQVAEDKRRQDNINRQKLYCYRLLLAFRLRQKIKHGFYPCYASSALNAVAHSI